MATQRSERRLAAILAADIAGYSRLVGADEEGTLAQMKGHCLRESATIRTLQQMEVFREIGRAIFVRHAGYGLSQYWPRGRDRQ